MKDFLERLLLSLNQIEVKGRTNMDYLMGCIMAVEEALKQLEAPDEKEEG